MSEEEREQNKTPDSVPPENEGKDEKSAHIKLDTLIIADKIGDCNSHHDFAMRYLDMGFSIFPLWEKDKRPMLSKKNGNCTWQDFQHQLPSQEQIGDWWTRWEKANIGLITGEVSGVIVLDIDGQEGFDYLESKGYEIPETPYVKTGKGYHYYLKHPRDGKEYRNFARGKIKIDLRGDGGYVVAPPSLHPDGGRYEWGNTDKPLAELPSWLVDMIHHKPEKETEVSTAKEEHEEEEEYPESHFEKVVEGCSFIRECVENATTLSEPEWHSALSIAIHCVNGEEKGHEISQPYPSYSYEETQRKIEKLMEFGPKTCAKIQEEHGDSLCQGCKWFGKGRSPISLGYKTKLEQAKMTIEEALKIAKDSEDSDYAMTPEVIGSLAIVARKDPDYFGKIKDDYQDHFKISESALLNMIAKLKGEPMGKVLEHPKKKEEEARRIISLIQVNEEDKFFYVWEGKGEQRYPERISNFVMTPIYSLQDQNGDFQYTVKIESLKMERVVTIDPKSLTSNTEFKKFCKQKGDFNWLGKPTHLDWLNEYLTMHETPTVYQIDYVGYNKDHKGWIFPSHAFFDGKLYHADEREIIEADGKLLKVMDNVMYKVVKPLVKKEPSREEILEYFQNFLKIYGYQGLLGLGWVVAGFQVHMFEEKMDTVQFPFLYATGIFQSGKTQFMKRIAELAGLKPKFDTNPTKDIWRKSVKAFGSLPVNFDELRDTGKNGFFNQMREVINKTFDRDEHRRGTIDPNAPLVFPTNAIVGMSGEVPTEDSAIMSRTIFIHSIKFTRDSKAFNKLARSTHVSNWIAQYLQRTSHDWEEIIYNAFDQALSDMDNFKIDSRELNNYALCIAGVQLFTAIFNIPDADKIMTKLIDFVQGMGEQGQKDTRENHPSIQYLVSLGVLSSGMFPKLEEGEHYMIQVEDIDGDGKEEHVLYLAPEDSWEVYKKETKDYDAFYNSSRKIKNDLESFKFFVGIHNKKSFRNGRRINAWKINLDHPDIPEIVQNYFIKNSE